MTGATGMLGRFVANEVRLSRPEWDLIGFDREAASDTSIELVLGDATNPVDLMKAVAGADVVVHLAGIRRPGLADDAETFRVNAIGTFSVFDACARQGVRRVVFTSSTAILGTDWGKRKRLPRYLPYDDDHPLEPEDAYGLSKVVGEAIAQSFYLRGSMEVAVLRFSRIVTPEELGEFRDNGGTEPRGLHHYAYVDVRDAATAVMRSIELHGLTYEAMFLAADDSSLAEPLSVVLPREIPAIGDMAEHLTGTRSGLSSERGKAILDWSATRTWRT